MKFLKLFESPNDISWYDYDLYYTYKESHALPFSICFKDNHTYTDKKVWKEEDYAGIIIGPMIGGHGSDVFSKSNPMYVKLRNEYDNKINYDNAINCRLWLKDRILSLWYDTRRKFVFNAIKDLEKELTKKIKDGSFNDYMGTRYRENWEEILKEDGIIKNGQFKIIGNRFRVDLSFQSLNKFMPLSRYLAGAGKNKKVDVEKIRKQELLHLQSMAQKASMTATERIPGWKPKKYKYQLPGETEVEARWRVNKYAYQEGLMNFEMFKLFESPEGITLVDDKNYLVPVSSAYQDDARAFGYYDGKLKVDLFHSMLVPKEVKWELVEWKGRKRFKKIKMTAEEARAKLEMPGRIWLDQKYISFWDYPKTTRDFKRLINDLETRFGIKIWNNPEWKVEILIKEKDGSTFDPKNLDWDIKQLPLEIVPMLIPVKEYNPVKNFDYQLPGEKEIQRHKEYINQIKKLKTIKDKNKGKHQGYNDLLDELTNEPNNLPN